MKSFLVHSKVKAVAESALETTVLPAIRAGITSPTPR